MIELDCFDGKDAAKEHEGHVSVPLKDFSKPGSYQKSYPLVIKNKAPGGNGFIEFDFVVEGTAPTQQVFKLPLEVVIAYQRQKYPDAIIPVFMRRSLDYLRKFGLDEEGIFRKSGAYDQINAAIEALDKGMRACACACACACAYACACACALEVCDRCRLLPRRNSTDSCWCYNAARP